jgi:hypothetical protein
MKCIGKDIAVIQHPFQVLRMKLGKTTTVIRLSAGGVLLHSAGPWSAEDVAAIRDWGKVWGIMEGSRIHDTFAREMRAVFPGVPYGLPAGFPIAADELQPVEPLAGWDRRWGEEVKVRRINGMPRLQEHVLLHVPSRTLVVTDLVFNIKLAPGQSVPWVLRWVSGLKAFPGTSRLVKLCVKDRVAVRESLAEVMSWDFDQVVVSHGEVITDNAKETLRRALDWGLAPG